MLECQLIDGAGHWVQQEQPGEVARSLLQFIKMAS
jgi:pimeloyl-ACP methyl ester carboxylesterase